MTTAELLQALSARSVLLFLEGEELRFRGPKGGLTPELRDEVVRRKAELVDAFKRGATHTFVRNPADRFRPFPLTDLQQAYQIGEQDFFSFQTVAHLYQCYRTQHLDVVRFATAVQRVVETHDVLRLVVRSAEEQCVLSELRYSPEYEDLRSLSPAEQRVQVEGLGANAGAKLSMAKEGPTWWVRVQRCEDAWFVHIAVRLLAFDAVTLHTIYRDLAGYYQSDDYQPQLPGLSYRDYVRAIDTHRGSIAAERARGYWRARLADLPPSPSLPRRRTDAIGQEPLRRLTGSLAPALWQSLQRYAKELGFTINAVLCRVYADTLSLWSNEPGFTLNLLSAMRPPVDPDVGRVVGNCSTTTLIAVPREGETFAARVAALQRQIYEDLAHSAVSGVEVIRELERVRPNHGEPRMPIVFSSGIALAGTSDRFELSFPMADWKLVAGRLSTPQVWLDHQVMEHGAELIYNWDYVPEHFPSGMVDAMFAHYVEHLETLAREPSAWQRNGQPLSDAHLRQRRVSNDTKDVLPTETLYEIFDAAVRRGPDARAVCTPSESLTYRELEVLASVQRERLEQAGVQSADLVVVYVQKGASQIAAVLGVLQAGATYVPVDAKTPKARVRAILEHSLATAVIVDVVTARDLECGAAKVVRAVDVREGGQRDTAAYVKVDASDTAYVIYTSGSTGVPKGVVIDHTGAINTLRAVNSKIGLRSSDGVLGLSSLAFDLSVFDMFGTFDAGASLILPAEEASPNPASWLAVAERYGATVWNSVPALLEMAIEYCGVSFASSALGALRLAMLSGDWLPIPLVERVLKGCPEIQLLSLGGATEVSIWSCYHEVERLDPEWTSVPYGRPLKNQTLHVLDEEGLECPDWKWGDLYIGGVGVMKGYLNDPERSRLALVDSRQGFGTLYKTGDRARWMPDGTVEFGGRKDNQVKLRGYRIELGEIEAALASHANVESAAVVLVGTRGSEQRLVGHVTPKLDPERLSDIERHIRQSLPAYMVPSSIVGLERMPLTANGKVDRSWLANHFASVREPTPANRAANGPTEHKLLALWKQVIGLTELNVEDDFFIVGGNSLLAVRLFNGIEAQFRRKLPLGSLFEARTVAAQAILIDQWQSSPAMGAATGLVPLRRATGPSDVLVVLVHPVGGDVLCYEELVRALPRGCEIHGVRSPAIDGEREVAATLLDMVTEYSAWIEPLCGQKRVFLAGWSMGGMLALECARLLRTRDVDVERVYMIDSWVSNGRETDVTGDERRHAFLLDLAGTQRSESAEHSSLPDPALQGLSVGDFLGMHPKLSGITTTQFEALFGVYERHIVALEAHEPGAYAGAVTSFRALDAGASTFRGLEPFAMRAAALLSNNRVIDLAADHYGVMTGAGLQRVVQAMAGDVESRRP